MGIYAAFSVFKVEESLPDTEVDVPSPGVVIPSPAPDVFPVKILSSMGSSDGLGSSPIYLRIALSVGRSISINPTEATR